MMECQACGRPLTKYDEHRVACKGGHVWTLPEFADIPPVTADLKPTREGTSPTRARVPAWVPGAVLGGLALVVAVLEAVGVL